MSNQPPAAPAAPSAASTKITEIRIGCPDEYDGKAETAQAWLDSVRLYLLIIHALYYDDDRKITFTLSYMKKGSAAIWAEVRRQQGVATLSFGTFAQFQQDFENTFVNTNAACEAMNWLSTTHINSGEQLQEYINTFKLNVVRAKYNEMKDTATLISYFSAGVPTWIMHCIQAMDTVPTTLALWYEKAAHFHLQKEITRKIALMHHGSAQPPCTTQSPRSSNFRPPRDPNTMDIDMLNLSPVERSHCLRDCLCSICKQPNCSTRNHPRNRTTPREAATTRPTRNPEQVRTTSTSNERDLMKYVKDLEGKGKKPAELLRLLQIAVDADETEEQSF